MLTQGIAFMYNYSFCKIVFILCICVGAKINVIRQHDVVNVEMVCHAVKIFIVYVLPLL